MSLNQSGPPAIQPRSTSIPVFTEQDVREYLGKGLPFLKIRALDQPTIMHIVFATVADLDRAWGEEYWRANYVADLPICYVELSGTFRVPGPPSLPGRDQRVITTNMAYVLFDASTGNLLAASTLSHFKWP